MTFTTDSFSKPIRTFLALWQALAGSAGQHSYNC